MNDEMVLQEMISTLNTQGEMAFLGGASEEQIVEFERNNNVVLPAKYKEWLRFSDGGECFLPDGVQFYGVAHKPFINVDDNDRPTEEYIVIGALATGDPILCERTGERISIYNLEAGRIEEDEIYEDFFAFLDGLYELLGLDEEEGY